MNHPARLLSLRKTIDASKFDALLVTHPPNIRYLCGFTGSTAALLVGNFGSVFFSDGRYTQQAHDEVQGAKIVIAKKAPMPAIAEWLSRKSGRKSMTVGVEGEHFTVASLQQFKGLVPKRVHVRQAPPLVERARLIKDGIEIEKIRAAVVTGADLFKRALQVIRPGVAEIEVAAEMEFAARKSGAEAMSFETIIASGPRSALPHGRASSTPIAANGFVVCDFGVILHGYCSDRTRTVWVGSAPEAAKGVYSAVLEAQEAGLAAVRPGVTVGDVDFAARKVLQKHKLAKYFTHSTGHGVGLEIHEAPRVANGQQELLRPGMVITVEPGVYLPGQWGVRIEDMVVVTETGCEVLTPTQKEFIVI
jgi:Xaa-Pro aminopeptidase